MPVVVSGSSTTIARVASPDPREMYVKLGRRRASARRASARRAVASWLAALGQAGCLALEEQSRHELTASAHAASDRDELIEMSGRGTMVSRQQPDGSWRIVLDDPLSH